MVNLLNGVVAIIILTMFLGGLAYSIWDNTESISFPIIVAAVLVMAYLGFYDEVKSGGDNN